MRTLSDALRPGGLLSRRLLSGASGAASYGVLTAKAGAQNVSGANVDTLITWDTQTEDMASNVWTCPASLDGVELIISCRCHVGHDYDSGGSAELRLYINGAHYSTVGTPASYWVTTLLYAGSWKVTLSAGDTVAMYGRSADTGSRINTTEASAAFFSIQQNLAA